MAFDYSQYNGWGREYSRLLTSVSLIAQSQIRFELGGDAPGDLYYANSSGNLARRGIGTEGQILTVVNGYAMWADLPGLGGSGEINDAVNLGSTGTRQGIYTGKIGPTFQLRSLVPGNNISFDTTVSGEIKINAISDGTGLTSAYVSISDGTVTASASGSDTIRFASANNLLGVAVSSGTPDAVTFTVSGPNIRALFGATGPISYSAATGNISIPAASGSVNGYLSSADWNVFNNRVASTRAVNTQYSITGGGNLSADRTINLVGDVAAPGNGMLYGTNAAGVRGWYAIPVGTVTEVAAGNIVSGSQTLWVTSVSNATTVPTVSFSAANQAALSVYSGPASGSAAPTFKALTAAYIPGLDAAKIITGVLPVARGGTGIGGVGSAGQLLRSTGTALEYWTPDFTPSIAHNHPILNNEGFVIFNMTVGTGMRFVNSTAIFSQVEANGNISFHHSDTSNQSSVTGLTGTAVFSGVLVDGYGHVTGLQSRNLQASDLGAITSLNHSHFVGINGANIFSFQQEDGFNFYTGAGVDIYGTGGDGVTIRHSETTNQTSITGLSGAQVFNGIALDSFGHVAGLSYRTITAADIGAITSIAHEHPFYLESNSEPTFSLTVGTGMRFRSGNFTNLVYNSDERSLRWDHADTSNQATIQLAAGTNQFIRTVQLDTSGHVIALESGTVAISAYDRIQQDGINFPKRNTLNMVRSFAVNDYSPSNRTEVDIDLERYQSGMISNLSVGTGYTDLITLNVPDGCYLVTGIINVSSSFSANELYGYILNSDTYVIGTNIQIIGSGGSKGAVHLSVIIDCPYGSNPIRLQCKTSNASTVLATSEGVTATSLKAVRIGPAVLA